MKICFLMYPWDRIEPETDSTLRLIHEAASRGITVAITTPNNLTVRESVAYAFCNVLKKTEKISSNVPAFYKSAEFKRCKLPLAGFDAIVMRANPPLDTTALNFLDSVRNDVFIMNDIDGLRIANNKLYPASFSGEAARFIPVTHVSKSQEYLEQVLDESATEKMIMKPLNGFGGQGVIVVEKNAQQNFRSLLEFYIGSDDGNYVILQEYVEGAHNGDVRILMLNGEPIGAMRRVPSEKDIRSNIHAGGKEVKHSLSKEEKQLCKALGPQLVRDGLYLVGLDVINGKLIEVNVLSPGGITRINKLNRTKLQKRIIDFLENVVSARELVIERKNSFRKVIEDAEAI
ncbi:glutathione synthetase [Solemya velum gill symbiont]|uniref:Glutathione synthetase n=1 Tax=Solemya velum gill symbiont TaxID=2340 RepID=A0A1T2CHT2_SOVGS|nr:glutathione synthase [Solemya velum gill symbiont]OOY34430.1 glutathione synthetase [Solemya velum gill symbiont]OOY37144.1 glutathione synthetase [Solemya velum gill symbiont]OOY46030.1 glutathione synthetase [Solemya velum gill symbiont]OOZ12244.1 glutathione synthetase [Solemya velum gill symbiont]